MTNHTTHTAPAGVPETDTEAGGLCITCRIADGRPHAHPRDHLRSGPVDCACADHDDDTSAVDFGLTDWRDAEALPGRYVWGLRERGPPLLAAA